jgi:hypothetical protein
MIINDIPIYTGKELHQKFGYKYYRDKATALGCIIAFRAPAKVQTDGLIDLEDSLSNDFIESEDMVHFMWETNLIRDGVGAVAFQRLFITQVANILYQYIKSPIEVKGDDLIVKKEHKQGGIIQQEGKASVSITYCNNQTVLGHLGINRIAGKHAPAFAYSTNLTEDQCISFMNEVISCFYTLLDDLYIASIKVEIPR